MPPNKYPEAEDRASNADADIIDLEAERRRRDRTTAETNANNAPSEPGADGAGAQTDPI